MKININNEKFLDKEKDIKHKDTVTLASEGIWEDSKNYKKEDGTPNKQFNINIKLNNEEIRSTTISFANIKLLVMAFGDETESWVGKEVRAWKTKSEKAKTGYVYVYVPIDWDRDDTGEWIKGDSNDYPLPENEGIDINDIPFD